MAVTSSTGVTRGPVWTRLVLTVTLVAYLGLAVGYATLTPIWQNPDEPAHYNYIAFVAETGGLPELKSGDWDLALLERLKIGALQSGDNVGSIRYESWQPPLFYLLAAPVYKLGPIDLASAVLRLRLLDVLLGAVTLGFAYLVGREILPIRLAAAVPMTMTGVPMFTSVSSAISADPLANLLSAALLLVCVRRANAPGGESHRWPVAAGALLGLGLLTKLALAIFLPIALLVLLWRAARPMREASLLLGMTFVVTLPWLVHQVTTYGLLDPLGTTRHASVVLDQQRFPGLSLTYVVDFATITFHSFWAQFGWMGIVAPDRLYWVYGLWVAIALVGLGRSRCRFNEPAWRLVALTVLAACAALVGYNLTFEQFQGRYLFPAVTAIAALLVAGWAAWLPPSAQRWGVLLAGVTLLILNAYALSRVLVPGFAATG